MGHRMMAAAHLRGPDLAPAAVPQVHLRGCTGKQPLTRLSAEAVLARRGRGVAYVCRHCRRWHTSHLVGVPTEGRLGFALGLIRRADSGAAP